MITHDIDQKTDEWMSLRNGKLTASDAQTIQANGKGLETLCFEKVAEIMTGKPKPSYTNEDMERGVELEATARQVYELETGNVVEEVGFVELDHYTGCSPDGLIGDDGLVEIKCKNDTNYVRYLYDMKIDPAHYWQMQMQMWVTERKWCDYVVFNENFEKNTTTQRVDRNELDISFLKMGVDNGIKTIKNILEKVYA
jgi:putative phage-type endonuclease